MSPITFTIIEIVGVTVVSFSLGFALGFVVARRKPEEEEDIRLKIAIFITIVWASSVVGSIFISDYQTSIWIHAIMGAITGYLFGVDNPLLGGGSNG